MIHITEKSRKYDPDYRNVQAELWSITTNSQHGIIGGVFRHLKNHIQIEISDALIDYLEEGIKPEPTDWSSAVAGGLFDFIVEQIRRDAITHKPSRI